MDVQIPEEQFPMVVKALEHYAYYLKATNRDDRAFRALAESLKRKPVVNQRSEQTTKRKRA